MRRPLMSLFVLLGLVLAVGTGKAQAQIIGEMEADIPFQFHVGDTRLPAGKYLIKALGDSDLTVMEITSADGRTSALFEVHGTQADTRPTKTELVFDKYGDQYFLSKLFYEGAKQGSQVPESHYQKILSKGETPGEGSRVPAHHRGQQAG
jgi:hypothetical protein